MSKSNEYSNLAASTTASSASFTNGMGSDSLIMMNGRAAHSNGIINGSSDNNNSVKPLPKARRQSETSMDEEDDKNRMSWGSKVEFVLSIVSYAVGLGNIW